MWRALTEYTTGTSYTDFKKAVLKAYPEVKEDLDGTLEELERLCRENKGIKRAEEGRLKRFGMRFSALVRKLRQPPAIILNKEACKRYLDTPDRGFAETLRMAINTRNLIKEDLPQAAANVPPPAGTVDYRKEDPIQLEELVKMAERLANKGTESTWDEPDEVEIKRSDKFPIIKVERRDERLEEINGEISSLRDALAVSQRQAKVAHEELLRAFQSSKQTVAEREEHIERDSGRAPSNFGAERQYGRGYGGLMQRHGCYYCDGSDHYSKECAIKAGHIHKGWITVEDGQQRLADGNYIPRGRGSAAARVEEYWQRKSSAGQNLNEIFYGAYQEDEFDALRDEV
ncbi:CCHC-type domain-containing protein [Mycena sanguinolenta]|uniref:CCHC-type domain-containing protein n=1 Tax=Mycena sanguinolenta TaxID=230812 RepID=A0A8H6XE08_9AGAR|nr:CCHC-type domain-containing protein [Mycena sanguinolenta]